MVTGGYEVIIGAKKDSLFGPVIIFGTGGIGVEIYKDFSVGLPPLNQTLAKRMIEETDIYHILKGYRNKPPANIRLLEEILVRFSNMLVDLPMIKEFDINPLVIDAENARALDARITIDIESVFKKAEPHSHLVISPYPKRYEHTWKLHDGRQVLLRPIKPEDEPMWLEMFGRFSESSIRYRFFHQVKDTPHDVRVRYCNIDYDREIAIVAELDVEGKNKIIGVSRVVIESDKRTGEIAFIVADPWQGLGLGTRLVDYIIDICREKKVETLYASVLSENRQAAKLLKKMGFSMEPDEEGISKARLDLIE
jgi:acetyltransferase